MSTPVAPLVRLEVEGVRHQVLHYLGMYQEEFTRIAKEQVDKVVNSWNFERLCYDEAVRQLEGILREEVRLAAAAKVSELIEARLEQAFGNPVDQARRAEEGTT
jgi:hypothetical protein